MASAPTSNNALSRSTFSWTSFTQWLRGSFNVFTSNKKDLVNTPAIKIQSTGSRPGNEPPFPLLDELPDGHLEPNYQETIADAYYNAEQDAQFVKNGVESQSGGGKKKKTLKHKKSKGKTLKKTLKRKKGGSKRRLKRKGKK
tara:strand:- start:5038 stop:5463 length:426 start_codon:yes stop_codon:yes gene_type:complete